MASRYAATAAQNVASATDTVCTLTAETTTRGYIYYFCVSSAATPADNTIEWIVQRVTTDGTGTAVAAALLDLAEAAELCDFTENHTVEPTYTAATEVFDNAVNQRMSLQFNSNPDGEFVLPATAAAGFGWQPVHASFTGLVEVTCHWFE
mgnify:FL=1